MKKISVRKAAESKPIYIIGNMYSNPHTWKSGLMKLGGLKGVGWSVTGDWPSESASAGGWTQVGRARGTPPAGLSRSAAHLD